MNNKLIDKIEVIRSENNKNWMDVLRLAFKYAPEEASILLKEIYSKDKKINEIVEEMICDKVDEK